VFLETLAAGFACRALGAAAAPARRTLPNGIVLADPWPPRRAALAAAPHRPPYLASPPDVIPIDLGRQLFVDEFLIEESTLARTWHRAEYHPASPVMTPERAWERRDPHAAIANVAPSPSAMAYSDGVFYDPGDRLFKLWYMAGYQQHTALALSRDGIRWERPAFDVVSGTNIVSERARDSNTVWLDLDARDSAERFKMAGYDLGLKSLRLHVSRDGVRWREVGVAGPCGDRSTFFRNPFLDAWVFSLRASDARGRRIRRYVEAPAFQNAAWRDADPVVWTGADQADVRRADLQTLPELYNLDAVAYESVLLGLFTMYRGEKPDREKPNDISVAFSRDGFHWSREDRGPFITVSERPGDWNFSNVQSAGGSCLIVGDRLYFYVSGRQGIAGTALPGVCSTGLATLRRDGFASVSDVWPAGRPRPSAGRRAVLTTRPVTFSGAHLFVNADVDGELGVEVLDRAGRPINGFAGDAVVPVTGHGTRAAVGWKGGRSLGELAGEAVRFRFTLSRARLFAFWVSVSPRGASGGYVGAGGPGFSRTRDVNA
jgi:hypothetical protein